DAPAARRRRSRRGSSWGGFLALFCAAEWKGDLHEHASRGLILELEAMLAAVELFQARADVGQPDAPPGPDVVVPIHATPIVPDFQLQESIVRSAGSGYLHLP